MDRDYRLDVGKGKVGCNKDHVQVKGEEGKGVKPLSIL